MKHTIVAMLIDEPGVLNRVASLFRRRGFNIESITVGASEQKGISRMTVVVDGDDVTIEQAQKQLYKLIDVLKVTDLTRVERVQRELMLVKVTARAQTRAEIAQVCEMYKGQVVDASLDSMMLEITGPSAKLDQAIQLLRPYGIKEVVRTGVVAMQRGSGTAAGDAVRPPAAAAAD